VVLSELYTCDDYLKDEELVWIDTIFKVGRFDWIDRMAITSSNKKKSSQSDRKTLDRETLINSIFANTARNKTEDVWKQSKKIIQ